jgi:hypothetical protein
MHRKPGKRRNSTRGMDARFMHYFPASHLDEALEAQEVWVG